MSIMAIFLSVFLIAVGFILMVKKPLIFVIYWALFASSSDACGIVSYLNEQFKVYSFIMNSELLLCAAISFYKYKKRRMKMYNKYIYTALGFIFAAVTSFFIVGANGIYIHRIVGILCNYSPLILIIWMTNYEVCLIHRKKTQTYVNVFVYIQIIMAFLIVYLPEIGIDILNPVRGSNYIADGYLYQQRVFYLKDLQTAITAKYNFNGLGQFHNANDMGFYGIVGIFFVIYNFKKANIFQKVFLLILSILSLMLWGNSGMRGPVIGLAIGMIIYVFFKKGASKFFYSIGILSIIICFSFSEVGKRMISYFLPDASNKSVSGRILLRNNGIHFIRDHVWFGSGGQLQSLIDIKVDPHELPLRIACLFGVFAAAVIVYLVYVMPICGFIRAKEKKFFSVIAFSILTMVSITNNYCDIGLFYIMFSQSICLQEMKERVDDVEEKNSLHRKGWIADQCIRNADISDRKTFKQYGI